MASCSKSSHICLFVTFSGKPLPPEGLQLQIGTILSRMYNIKLSWRRSRTLFDQDSVQSEQALAYHHGQPPRPYYVVYAYIKSDTDLPFRLLFRNETVSLSFNVSVKDLDLPACNLSALVFYVSAKFDGVGEGNVSSPTVIEPSDADAICRAGIA